MPVESLIVSVCVVAMFVVFGAVLVWGDLQTRPKQLAQHSDRQTPRVLISARSRGRDRLQEKIAAVEIILYQRG